MTAAAADAFKATIAIAAPAEQVWACLTQADQMTAWMGEPGMALEVETDWVVGRPIVMRGVHHAPFENVGTVLAFQPLERLAYTHLSSLSQLADVPEHHARFEFNLAPAAGATRVEFIASGFPTDAIFKHLRFYWTGALEELKRHAER